MAKRNPPFSKCTLLSSTPAVHIPPLYCAWRGPRKVLEIPLAVGTPPTSTLAGTYSNNLLR